jgi:hypothetical protein
MKGSFWWRDILKLLDKFKGLASVQIKDGASCLFWEDCWDGQPLRLSLPELYSFAKKPIISCKRAFTMDPPSGFFNLPLLVQAFTQFQALQQTLQHQDLTNSFDTWTYIWVNTSFTSKQAYNHLRGSIEAAPIFSWIWKSSCQLKHKVFFWLLVQDRVSTTNVLRRKHMYLPSYDCILCNENHEETIDHLFLECIFSRDCWALIGLMIVNSPFLIHRIESLKLQIAKKFFMEIIIIMCWTIWTVRNDAIFRGVPPTVLRGLEIFKTLFKQLL